MAVDFCHPSQSKLKLTVKEIIKSTHVSTSKLQNKNLSLHKGQARRVIKNNLQPPCLQVFEINKIPLNKVKHFKGQYNTKSKIYD